MSYIGPRHGDPLFRSQRDAEKVSAAIASQGGTRTPEHTLLALLAAQSIEWGTRLIDLYSMQRTPAVETFIALGLVASCDSVGWDGASRPWLTITPAGLAMLATLDAGEDPDPVAYRWIVQFDVPASEVAAGLELSDYRVADMLGQHFGWVPMGEIGSKVLLAPDPLQIRAEQGGSVPGYTPFACDDDCGECKTCRIALARQCAVCGGVMGIAATCDEDGNQIGSQFDCDFCDHSEPIEPESN